MMLSVQEQAAKGDRDERPTVRRDPRCPPPREGLQDRHPLPDQPRRPDQGQQPQGTVIPSDAGEPPPQTGSSQINIVSSYEELDVDASLSASGSYNGSGYSVHGAASFKNDFSFSETKLNYLVHVDVQGSPVSITDPVLVEGAKQMLGGGPLGAIHLYQSLGDSYVSQITCGGLLYGLIKITFESMQDKLDAQQSLSVSAVGTGKINTDASEAFTKIQQKHTMSISIYSVGARDQPDSPDAGGPPEPGPELQFARPGGGTIIDYELTPISSVVDYEPDQFGNQTAPPMSLSRTPWSIRGCSTSCGTCSNSRTTTSLMASPDPTCCTTRTSSRNLSAESRESPRAGSESRKCRQVAGLDSQGCSIPTDPCGGKLPSAYQTALPSRQPMQVTFPALSTFIPVATHQGPGDKEMAGHNTLVNVGVTYQLQSSSPGGPPDQIVAFFSLDFKEDQHDWTEFSGQWSGPVYTVPEGLYIVSHKAQAGGINLVVPSGTVGKHQYTTIQANVPGAMLASIDCLLDTKGPDEGKLYAVNAAFNPVDIQLDHVENYNTSKASAETTEPVAA